MKNSIKNLAIALLAFTAFSFIPSEGEKKVVNTEKSKVIWKGYKVTGSHQGTIAIKSGFLTFDEGKLAGGEFTMDMTTISNTDMKGKYKGKLEEHLKSDDFFGVTENPTATLVFKEIMATGKNSYEVTGNMTIKGITNAVTFDLSVYGSKANASLKIDRTKYNVKYGSTSFFEGLKDKAIYDEFDLVADLEF